MSQCEYILDNDKRCKRQAILGSKYCWQHQTKKTSLKEKSPRRISLYFDLLPTDLLSLLFLYFNPEELLFQLEQLPEFSKLLQSKIFWQNIWKRDISSIVNPPSNVYQKYKEIFKHFNSIYTRHEKISYSARNGYDILLLPILLTLDDYNWAMAYAAEGGHIEIVKLMLEKGANNYNLSMENAAYGGHMEIVKLMLEKGANDYNRAMEAAALSGHMEIVRLMLEKGANYYDWAMETAAGNGHIEIVRLMLEKGANDYNSAMSEAAYRGQIEIVRLMLEKGANNYNEAMENAAWSHHDNIVTLLRSYL